MSDGNNSIIREVFFAEVSNGSLDKRTGNWVRPIKHDDLASDFRRGFQEIAKRGLVSVKPNAGGLNVDHDGIKLLENFRRGPARSIAAAINAVHRNTRRSVFGILDVRCIQNSGHSVLGAENRIQ